MKLFVPQPSGIQLLLDGGCVIRAAPADGDGVGEEHYLPAVALDHDAPRAPRVDFAEWHLLGLVVPLGTPYYQHHHLPPALLPNLGGAALSSTTTGRTDAPR